MKITELAEAVVKCKRETRKALAEMDGILPGAIDKSMLYVLADDLIAAGQGLAQIGRQLADSIISDDTKSLIQMD